MSLTRDRHWLLHAPRRLGLPSGSLGRAMGPNVDRNSAQDVYMVGVKPGELVVDMAAGDGRIVIVAAREFGATARGVEIDPIRSAACWHMPRSRFSVCATGRACTTATCSPSTSPGRMSLSYVSFRGRINRSRTN